jgi:hypothetical protein
LFDTKQPAYNLTVEGRSEKQVSKSLKLADVCAYLGRTLLKRTNKGAGPGVPAEKTSKFGLDTITRRARGIRKKPSKLRHNAMSKAASA